MTDKPTDRDAAGQLVRLVTKQGRGVLIYRQYKDRDGVRTFSEDWTRRVVVNGKQYYFKLGPNRTKAAQVADQITAFLEIPGHSIAQAVARFAPDKVDQPDTSDAPTVGDILAAFERAQAALDLSPQTAATYRDRLLYFVRYVKAHRAGRKIKLHKGSKVADEPDLATPLSFLDRQAVADFKTGMVAEAKGDPKLEMKKKRSANTTLRNAKAVFSDHAREHYEHLKLPAELDGFVQSKPFRKVSKRYTLPTPETIKWIFNDLPSLRDGDNAKGILPDPNAYVAAMLALFAGLRKNEIAHMRRHWIRQNEGGTLRHRINVQPEKDFLPKAREEGHTEICDWALRHILSACVSHPYMLEGNETERTDNVFARLNYWLRDHGINRGDREQPCHELRKLFGSYVASKHGIFVAKTWLRHASVKTTEEYYADLVVSADVLKLFDPEGDAALKNEPAKKAK